MSPFHSGMNHWQRQWLSDRLHRKSQAPAPAAPPNPPERYLKPKGDAVVTKLLRNKPDPAKARTLLEKPSYQDNPERVSALLAAVPPDQLNNTARRSSSALEALVSRWRLPFHTSSFRDENQLKCIELLLNAGAHWNPPTDSIRRTRAELMKYDNCYIVKVLRLLVQKANGANTDQFIELCRSSALEAKIASVDLPLLDQIKGMRKAKKRLDAAHPPTASPSIPQPETTPSAAPLTPDVSEPPPPTTP